MVQEVESVVTITDKAAEKAVAEVARTVYDYFVMVPNGQ